MDTVRNYNRLALDYLNMAERTQYPATREEMTRLAQLWARLADQAKQRESAHQTDPQFHRDLEIHFPG